LYGNTFSYGTGGSGTYVTVTFTGTGIDLYSLKNSSGGQGSVIITDTGAGTVAGPTIVRYNSSPQVGSGVLYSASNLSNTLHTLILTDVSAYIGLDEVVVHH